MGRWGWITLLVAAPGSAQAQSLSVDQFLVKAHALKKKGMFALLSADLPPVRAEVKTIASSYRRDLLADRTAGREPHSCPPPEGSEAAKIKPGVFLAELERVPPVQRASTSMKTAFYQIMKRRWPCPTAALQSASPR